MALLSPGLVLGILTLSVVLYYTCRSIYNLFFHPLSTYPGPRLNAASAIPYNWLVIRGQGAMGLRWMHETYGPAVRYAPNALSYCGPEAWNEIYGPYTNGKKHMEMDPKIFGGNVTVSGALQITNAVHDDHRRMRARFMQALSARAIAQQEHTLQKYTRLFIDRVREELESHDGVVDMSKWTSLFTFDCMGDLALGKSFDNLQRGHLHSWAAVVFGAFKALPILRVIRETPGLGGAGDWITAVLPREIKNKWHAHFNYAFDLVEERLQNPKARKDFVYFLIDGLDVDMTRDEIKECAAQMVMAGSEPAASFLTGLVFFLGTNRTVYTRLRDEVRTAFSHPSQISVSSVAKLSYFENVVREGLRMFPPAAEIFPRIVPDGGEVICGQWLPGGTHVGIAALAASYSPTNFPSPETFDPLLWTSETPGMKASQPFGQGHRACLGKTLALAEIRLFLATLLVEFDLELVGGQRGWLGDCRVWIGWQKPPLFVRLTDV